MLKFILGAVAAAFVTSLATADESETRCIAFYGVPVPDGGAGVDVDYLVDPCWNGAHITLAGFHAYPVHSSSANEITASKAFGIPEAIAKKRQDTDICPAGLWYMNKSANAHFNGAVPPGPSASLLKLLLEKPNSVHPEPSVTWREVAVAIQKEGAGNICEAGAGCKHDPAKTHHISFDRCSCYEGSASCQPTDVLDAWGTKPQSHQPESRPEWRVIAVEYTGPNDCAHITPEDALPGDASCQGREMICDAPYDVVWHWDRALEVYCPEPSGAWASIVGLSTLWLLRRRR